MSLIRQYQISATFLYLEYLHPIFKKRCTGMMNKKGDLNLSIQAIVIVVIAFVVLGLGLGFVRGQFKSIQETSTGVQEQIRQQILEDLRRS